VRAFSGIGATIVILHRQTVLMTWVLWMWAAAPCFIYAQGSADLGGIEVTADQLEYEADTKLLIGRTNVVVRYGMDELRADYISVQTDTQDAHAKGNVVFTRGGSVWKGEEIRYNFRTKQGDFGKFTAFMDPYYVSAKESKRTAADSFILKNATITTCDGPHPEYRIHAREARIEKGEKIIAKGVTFFLGPIPILYVPRWTRQFGGDKTDIDLMPGYSSRMGPYLLTAYNYRLNDVFKASTHLDVRAKRGVGIGQDVEWGDQRLSYNGIARAYYLNDQSPLENRSDEEIEQFGDLIEKDRYRLRLADARRLGPQDTLVTEMNYLSDPGVLEDFFNREFRNNAQPENRISLTHREEQFTGGLQVNKRLNDFYGNVDRVPEAFLNVPRLQLGTSPFYYESQNSAGRLERVFPEKDQAQDYDTVRLDSGHTVYYPTRHFGFLNVMPRAGYRLTYYSATYDENVRTNVISTVDSNNNVFITNEVVRTLEDKGSELRHVFELGFETSFKAFSVWHNDPLMTGRDDVGLRHVVEPYARHTYIPEPNVLPADLPQFDEVDRIGKRHDVLLGVRNKFQTKRNKRIHDLVDADVWSTYRIEKEGEEEDFSEIGFDVNTALGERWRADFDGSYDPYESELTRFNTQWAVFTADDTRLSLEYRYQKDRRDQVAGELTLFPNRRWSFTTYGRYSFENSELEEHSYFVQHKGRCVGTGLGVRQVNEDFQVWLQLWLIAFPKSSLELGL
jgi:LPS-assembly protein